MKKLLVINTKYKIFGGEDSNILQEMLLLEKKIDVEYLEFDNSKKLNFIDLFAFLFLSNFTSNKKVKLKLKEFKPDYVYVHNTWFMANLGIFKVLKKENIKPIIKLHNFRFLCTNTFRSTEHLRNQKFCSMCGFKQNNLGFNMYFENSFFKSFFAIYYGKKYFKILQQHPFRILVLNNFYKKTMVQEGFDGEKINISYNPLNIEFKNNYLEDGNYVVYAGLVNYQKGVMDLIKAWVKSKTDLNLYVIGNQSININDLKKISNSKIKFIDHIENTEVIEYIKNSKAVITATRMYEGQPRLLTEASKLGVPSIYPSFGGMDEYFPLDYQLSYNQYDENALISKILLLRDNLLLRKESKNVYEHINHLLDEDIILKNFTKILQNNE